MKQFVYDLQPDERYKKTITEEPNDDTPQKRRVNELAEAQPGRIVVGWAAKSPTVSVEDEDYLDNLEGKAT